MKAYRIKIEFLVVQPKDSTPEKFKAEMETLINQAGYLLELKPITVAEETD